MAGKPRFPHARELFLTVKRIAAARRGLDDTDGVADYEIGRALGLSRDATSRFKNGQRDYTGAREIVRLAAEFDADALILLRVAAGEMSHTRAWKLAGATIAASRPKNRRSRSKAPRRR